MYIFCEIFTEYLKKTNSKFVGHVSVIRYENEPNILKGKIFIN